MRFLQHERREERPENYGYGSSADKAATPDANPGSGQGAPPPPPPPPYYPPQRVSDPRLKSPVGASLLSALFPGLGQIYLGFYLRGVGFALGMASIITALATGNAHHMEPLFGIAIGFTYFLNIIDANRVAHLYNQAILGTPGLGLPAGFKLPEERGSIAGGAVLVLLGLLLFLNRNFDFSLDWLADWWPLGVIGMGVWLIVRARRGKAHD